MFILDVGVEGRIAEVGLPARAGEVASLLVAPGPAFAFFLCDIFGVGLIDFGAEVVLTHAAI